MKREGVAEKKKPPQEEHLSARDRSDLDVSIKVQAAYQLGYKAGVTKGLTSNTTARAARGRVTLQRVEINALRSHLESAHESATAQTTLMSNITNERDELVKGQMCLVCMDQQRSIAAHDALQSCPTMLCSLHFGHLILFALAVFLMMSRHSVTVGALNSRQEPCRVLHAAI